MTPVMHRVVGRQGDRRRRHPLPRTGLAAPDGVPSGQFNMLTAFGVGEVAISISCAPRSRADRAHRARRRRRYPRPVASRGGRPGRRARSLRHRLGDRDEPWRGARTPVVVAGGHRPRAAARGHRRSSWPGTGCRGGRVFVLVGAREPPRSSSATTSTPGRRAGAKVAVTVDVAGPRMDRPRRSRDPASGRRRLRSVQTTALVCGPEIMMRFTARSLIDHGRRSRDASGCPSSATCSAAWPGAGTATSVRSCCAVTDPSSPTPDRGRLLTERER